MITGNPFIDSILENALTGRAAAALGPMPVPFVTPPFVPQTPATRPRTVTTPEDRLRQAISAPVPAPPAPGPSPSQDVIQTILGALGNVGPAPTIPQTPSLPPIDPSVVERFKAMVGQAPAAYVPPTPVKQTFLQGLTQALQRGVQAGLTRDPGATLMELGQRDVELSERRRAEEIRKQERAEDRQDRFNQTQRQFELAGVQEATRQGERAQDIEIRRGEKQFDREFQEWVRRLGLKDQGAMELLRDALQTERDKERERASDERLTQQQRLQLEKEVGDQIRFYKRYGVKDQAMAKRLAWNDYKGIAEQLKAWKPEYEMQRGDTAVLSRVEAEIGRLQRLAAGGGGGGRGGASGADKIQTWVELSSGDIVPADKVNFDRLPVGVTVKRMFATVGVGGPELTSGGATSLTLEEAQRQIGVMRNASKSVAEINAAIDSMIKDNPKMKGELEKLRVAPAPGRDFTAPVFANPEGTAFGISGGGTTSISPEDIRRRIEESKKEGTIKFIENRLREAFKERDEAQRAGNLVRESTLNAEIRDLNSRLRVAQGSK